MNNTSPPRYALAANVLEWAEQFQHTPTQNNYLGVLRFDDDGQRAPSKTTPKKRNVSKYKNYSKNDLINACNSLLNSP